MDGRLGQKAKEISETATEWQVQLGLALLPANTEVIAEPKCDSHSFSRCVAYQRYSSTCAVVVCLSVLSSLFGVSARQQL